MKSKLFIIFLVIIAQALNSQDILHHNPGLFLGTKYAKQSSLIAPAFGINYEYKFDNSDLVTGIGMSSEIKFTEQVEMQIGPAFYIHPVDELGLYVSPSIFYTNYGNVANTENLSYIELNERTGSQTRFVLRFGAMYEFPYQLFNISPNIGVDLIGNNYEAFFGVNISAPINF